MIPTISVKDDLGNEYEQLFRVEQAVMGSVFPDDFADLEKAIQCAKERAFDDDVWSIWQLGKNYDGDDIRVDRIVALIFGQRVYWVDFVFQSAILAEREACAKIVESYSSDLGNAFAGYGALGKSGLGENIMEGFRIAAAEIRARSNPAPENALESPEALQTSTYPAPILKTGN